MKKGFNLLFVLFQADNDRDKVSDDLTPLPTEIEDYPLENYDDQINFDYSESKENLDQNKLETVPEQDHNVAPHYRKEQPQEENSEQRKEEWKENKEERRREYKESLQQRKQMIHQQE